MATLKRTRCHHHRFSVLSSDRIKIYTLNSATFGYGVKTSKHILVNNGGIFPQLFSIEARQFVLDTTTRFDVVTTY
jgi:hypothetical protein